MNKRITLGAAVAAAGLLVVPSMASATSSCTWDQARHQAVVRLANNNFGGTTTIGRSFAGGTISVDDNNGTGPNFCSDATGVIDNIHTAKVTTVDKILVKGSPNFEHLSIDETQGTFAPGDGFYGQTGNRRVHLVLTTGTGNDVVDFHGTGFADAYSASNGPIGATVDMDNDGDIDAGITIPGAVGLYGGFGDDRLSATSVFGVPAGLPVALDGEIGNDTLFGGSVRDTMLGGLGNDFINAVGGGADVVAGLDGTDTAFVDSSDTVSTVESKTVKVGTLSGSKKTIKAAAGSEASLSLAWTHPKAWKNLKSITATMFDGAKTVGTITLTPAGKVTATGKIASTTSTIGHHGKTVTAKLGFKAAKSLKGRTLSVDVAATDQAGKTQTENAARSIRLS